MRSVLPAFLWTLQFARVFAPDSGNYDANRLLETFVANSGYRLEIHHTVTEDGYVLTIHRIRSGNVPKSDGVKRSPAVLMMHGLLLSSADWMLQGRNRSLAFLLVDNGYDVWLGNNRGTTFSKNHTSLSSTDRAFWNFSYHELGLYDASAIIDYILEQRKEEERLFYIGYSQGTTQFWVLTSLRPEYNEKIRYMAALAPVAYGGNTKGLLKGLSYWCVATQAPFDRLGYFPVLSSSRLLRDLLGFTCGPNSLFEPVCELTVFAIGGFDPEEFDQKRLRRYLQYFPAGCSYKQLIHYAQNIVNAGHFRPYDYGRERNLRIYRKILPPEYPLNRITAAVGLYVGLNDYLATPRDVELLRKKLPNVIHVHPVAFKRMNHLDFIYGIHARSYLYNGVIDELNALR